jgi:hypothetical protein
VSLTRPRPVAAALALFGVLLLAAPAPAAFVVYPDRAAFDAATTGRSVEDFGEALTVPGAIPDVVSGPISITSTNVGQFNMLPVFVPGDIIPNLVVDAAGPDPNEFFVDDSGSRLPTATAPVALTTNFGDDFARFDFDLAPVTAFAIDLGTVDAGADPDDPDGEYTVRVFGAGNVLLRTFAVPFTAVFDPMTGDPIPTSVFFGFASSAGVTRVEVEAPLFETFSNVTLATGPEIVVPAPGGLALVLAAGPAGLLLRRRVRS